VTRITALDRTGWTSEPTQGRADEAPAVEAIERGDVLFYPRLAFPVLDEEAALFSPAILSSAKNASFDPASDRLTGTTLPEHDVARLRGLMRRFSAAAARLIDDVLPLYRGRMRRARASFRPAEIEGRASSWRKDDTRLHVDSFPASPVQGRRILRVFANVNPHGRPRAWRVGDDFEALVGHFASRLSLPWPGQGTILELLRLTKSRRTPYDALMLQLHDRMKEDVAFQRETPQTAIDFPAGTTWVAFTDQVSHAAMSGQYQLEQTFLLPVEAMMDENRSPLRLLERRFGRRLA
jgi:hypothetical protein